MPLEPRRNPGAGCLWRVAPLDLFRVFTLGLLSISGKPAAQTSQVPSGQNDLASVSYSYATLMGSGTYQINGRRITMVSLPLEFSQQALTRNQPGLKWYVPVVIGHDSVSDPEWLDDFFDKDLVTLSVLPGFEYQYRLDNTWALKPFAHLGAAHDSVSHETAIMGVLGARLLGTWQLQGSAEFRFGAALRFAGEHQTRSGEDYHFAIAETGLDYRHDTRLTWGNEPLNAGIYYRLEYFQPDWELAESPLRRSDIELVHELGVSVGLPEPVSFLGMTFGRFRVGYKVGDGLEGWTFGTEFPF